MPLSPQVQKLDWKGEQLPGYAIVAFVSIAEKDRFLNQFANVWIRVPIAITMSGRGLKCRTVTPCLNDRGPRRENRSEHRKNPGFNLDSHVTDGGVCPIGPGSIFYVTPQSYPYYVPEWHQYGVNGVSGSYPQYLPQQYNGPTGHTTTDYCPNHRPPLGATSPMGTTARPPTWANCRYMDLPRLPAVSPRTRLWAPGWTRDIWAGVNMCSVERFRAQIGNIRWDWQITALTIKQMTRPCGSCRLTK